ncbi:MAG: CoA-transferase [Actinomycetota bacterium]
MHSKLMSLQDAVSRFVKPGDKIHLGVTHARGTALAWELVRQFYRTDPGFELHAVAMSTPMAPLVHAGLAKKVVTSWAGDSYYTPGPDAIYQRAWKSGDVEFSHWTILSYVQRLAAAARGLEWTTTRSIIGSTMQEDNAADFKVLEDGTGLARALHPDVSIFHAPAADESGSVLMVPPLMESTYGALAAKRGAIITVEKIVDASFIREHAHLTRIPSSAVLAVVEAPMGAHPGGIFTRGLDGIEPYGEDYDFWYDIRTAAKDPAMMDAWMKEWILEPRTQMEYLGKLGADRIALLKERASGNVPSDVIEALSKVDLDAPANEMERAIVAMSRSLTSVIRENGYRTMLAGAGMANIAAWMSARTLTEEGLSIDLAAEMGLVGYQPAEGEPFIFNHRNFPACTMLADIDWTLSILVGGGTARSIGALGAAQVDMHGNLNSTMIPGKLFLMGSGGANDVATCATETVVVVTQSRERMLEHVDYITCPGARVTGLVTTHGIYRKDQGELVLTDVFDPSDGVKQCIETCGWPLKVARSVNVIDPPTHSELTVLRNMDPNGWFRN